MSLLLRFTKTLSLLPKEEIYGIISQIRRAALSVALNIVEGYGRQGKKEFKQFLNIALGSLAEVKYLLDFSFRLKYLSKEEFQDLQCLSEEVGKILWKFYKTL